MSKRRALITGITGQDGSYLAEFLLEQGYEVHGMVRRSSSETFQRLQAIRDDLTLHTGDLLDQRSLTDVLRESQPDEVYNLAAMSFVAASWTQPVLTAEFTGVGVTRMLEAVRDVVPEARFYQASSSEMFGKVLEVPQTETTPFYPRSPYGVAKTYGHFITVNYRESYDLFCCSGILFNHECIAATTPLVVRENGVIAIKTPLDLVALRRKGRSVQSFTPSNLLEIWDGEDWTTVRAISAVRRRRADPDHRLLSIQARGGVVDVTAHHRLLDGDWTELVAGDVEVGDRLALSVEVPERACWTVVSEELAELLGLLAGDGYVARDGATLRFTNNDDALRARVAQLWSRLFLGSARDWVGRSGWDPSEPVHAVDLTGARSVLPWLREQLYTAGAHKQVPPLVLNANREAQQAFLRGYYAGDGLKRGNGLSVVTNSAVLAQGLAWLYQLNDQPVSVYVEERGGASTAEVLTGAPRSDATDAMPTGAPTSDGRVYYRLNIPSAVPVGARGAHLRKSPAEVREIADALVSDDEWVFDLETESGVFNAGVGRLVVHNSPRRGLEFVTRKVTHGAAAIKLGLQEELVLGNLDAERDWGYARDYVQAMWMMLQAPEPEDYVIATGIAHSVRDLVRIAFDHVGLDHGDHVRQDARYMRPAEVDHLIGDYSKAKRQLGWEPTTSFEQLVRLMVDADLELLARGVPQKQMG